MNSRKKLVQTGLELKVKPVSDRGMTEEEYRAKVAELKKEAQIKKQQEAHCRSLAGLPLFDPLFKNQT